MKKSDGFPLFHYIIHKSKKIRIFQNYLFIRLGSENVTNSSSDPSNQHQLRNVRMKNVHVSLWKTE